MKNKITGARRLYKDVTACSRAFAGITAMGIKIGPRWQPGGGLIHFLELPAGLTPPPALLAALDAAGYVEQPAGVFSRSMGAGTLDAPTVRRIMSKK